MSTINEYPKLQGNNCAYLDSLKSKLNYAKQYHPEKVAYYEQQIKDWNIRPVGNIKAEFRRHLVHHSVYYSLYVNGQKTNIYYPEKPSEFFLVSKEKAESEAHLIRTGQIFPHDGNYEHFDTCGTFYANLQDAKKVDKQGHFFNSLYHCSGRDYSQEEAQNEEMKKIQEQTAFWTQWTKRISKETGEFLQNIGVKFFDYGYTVFYY